MFANKNYEFLLDFDEYDDHCGLYWIYMYNKLFSLGRDEDRYELEKLYNECKNDAPFPFNILTALVGFGDDYRKTCQYFIHNVKMANYNDDDKREDIAKRDMLEKEQKELQKKISINTYGYDVNEARENAIIEETRLDLSHNEVNNDFVLSEDGESYIQFGGHACIENNVKVLKEETKVIENYKGAVTVHSIMFDKFHGYYYCVIYATDDLDENGNQRVYQEWSKSYADKYISIPQIETDMYGYSKMVHKKFKSWDGIDTLYRTIRDKLYQNSQIPGMNQHIHDIELGVNKPSKKQSAKLPKDNDVDISKINQALGLEDTGEDLNGNIF